MTRRQQLLAGTVALCLVIVAAGYFLLAQPRRDEVKQIKDGVVAQSSTNASMRAQVSSLQAIQAQLPAQRRQVDQLSSKVPTDPALVTLIRQLSQAATASNVTLSGIVPTRPAPIEGAAGLSGLQLSLTVNGDYVSLEQFQIALERLQRSFLVSQVTFAENNGSSTGTGATTPAGAAATTDAAGITATIIGRVLTGTAGAGASPAGTTTS